MALFFINVFTGEAEGDFHRLRVRDGNGNMTDILTLIGSAAQFISSVASPLAVSNGQLSINLNNYVTSVALTNTLSAYRLIANSFSQINVAAPLSISSTSSSSGTSVTIDSLFKPSSVSVGASSGLFAVANDQTGVLALSCNGSENRSQVRLVDANSVLRLITASITGDLLWDGGVVAMASQLSTYQPTLSATAPMSITNNTIAVDLTGYTDTAGLNTILAGYTDTAGLNTILAGYTNTVGLNTILAGYTNTAGINTILAGYTDTVGLNTILAGYTDTAGLTTILAGYTNTASLNTILAGYTNTAGLNSILAGYTNTTGINSILAGYTDTAGLNNILAGYTDTASLTTILAGYTDTTGLNTILAGYTDTAGLNAILTGYTDTSGLNTILAGYTDTAGLNTILAGYTDTAGLNTLLVAKQDTISVSGQGVFKTGSTLSGYDLRWDVSNVPSSPIQCLHYKGFSTYQNINLATSQVELIVESPVTAAQLALKQNTLQYYSEGTENTNIGQYQYGPTNTPAWTNAYYTNNGNDSQNITFQVYVSIGGTTLNQPYMWSMDLKSDNNVTPEILVTIGDTTSFSDGKIFSINDAWQTVQLPWLGMSTNAANLHLGYNAPPLGLTQPGGAGIQVQLRNFAIYEVGSQASVAISQQLSVASDVRIAGSLINTSDKRLKTDVETLDPATAMSILQAVEPKTYQRTDGQTGRRAGFLADDIMDACLENELYVGNIVSRTGDGQYLGLDYARLSSLLWSCCKTLDAKCNDLESRISALEKT